MKLPNGYGSVHKLPGKRRKPWRVRITVGRELIDGKSKQIYKTIGYYPTQKEALQALADYNENPYDIDVKGITFSEVFSKWSAEKYPTISQSNQNGYNASFRDMKMLHDIPFVELKLSHLQGAIDNSEKNYPTLKKNKILLNQLFNYAIRNEILNGEKNISEYVDISKYKDRNPNKYERTIFTSKELKLLWENSDDKYIQIVLILIYSGLRISELLELKKEDVHIDEKYLDIKKSKTDAGIRFVPISDKILPFIKSWMDNSSDYLICTEKNRKFTYRNFRDAYWNPVMTALGAEHKCHDTRHTTISLLTVAGVDERIIKKIVGHAGSSITENVYTHIDLKPLLEAINRL